MAAKSSRSFLGKCRGCKRTVQVSCNAADTVEARRTSVGKLISAKRIAWQIVGGALDGTRTPLAAAWNGKWQLSLVCPHCAVPMMVQAVAGTYSANHPCGARCLASKGPTCECSCGGKNHGALHAV
jgi:hypothetical protein